MHWVVSLAAFNDCSAVDNNSNISRSICLLAELLLAQFVESVELLGKHDVLLEPAAGQLHSDDDCPVWNHHRNRSKVDLQVLRQFLPTRVARILQTDATSD